MPKEGTMTVPTGAVDEFGHPRLGGIGYALEREIEERTGLRDPRHGARARPARRHADRVRPGAGDPAGAGRDRRGARRRVGDDGRAAVD